jgi:hypothetical protein
MANRKDVALLKQGSGRLEPLASSRALRSAQDHVLALLALGLVALIVSAPLWVKHHRW